MMNNKKYFPLDFVQCCFLFLKQLPTGTLLPCSVLILSMAKNQSDVENLVKNCPNCIWFETIWEISVANQHGMEALIAV